LGIRIFFFKKTITPPQRKTETMVISKTIIKPHHPPIYMNDAIIREVEQHKHLGVIFQDNKK
jgi:hypothetical protein